MISPTPPPSDDPSPLGFTASDVDAFINAAMKEFESLSLSQRAAFDAIAAVLIEPFDPNAAQLARTTAAFLREADTHQTKLFGSVEQAIKRKLEGEGGK